MSTINNNIRCSYDDALAMTLDHMPGLPTESVDLSGLVGRVLAEDIVARVNSPSINCSLKDGYAVQSADITSASPQAPVRLRLVGHASAGNHSTDSVSPGTAIRILSGAEIPAGADAVIAEEFTTSEGDMIAVANTSHAGRNILPLGSDITAGEQLFAAGLRLRPTQIGLLAAAGYASALVYRRPRVAVIATGDEVIAPGMPLQHGKLFASNLVTLAAWCTHYGMEASTQVVPDNAASIRAAMAEAITTHDAIITSGGAWKGERDLVARVLDDLGWTRHYHRVRLGPGKAVGFGLLEGKAVFCLPGGPPS
ncbi:MAG: molybdopterin molybdotransferase MoeA, partial [Anaerolineae bacterium]|nr:molybdopterin molybdotransferase MoeA [Anaerolineae bacterium]